MSQRISSNKASNLSNQLSQKMPTKSKQINKENDQAARIRKEESKKSNLMSSKRKNPYEKTYRLISHTIGGKEAVLTDMGGQTELTKPFIELRNEELIQFALADKTIKHLVDVQEWRRKKLDGDIMKFQNDHPDLIKYQLDVYNEKDITLMVDWV